MRQGKLDKGWLYVIPEGIYDLDTKKKKEKLFLLEGKETTLPYSEGKETANNKFIVALNINKIIIDSTPAVI